MYVNPDAHAEYERRHQPIWEEFETTLKDHRVTSYSIFLEPESNQLFAYAEIESEERWAAIAETDVCRRWWAYMRDLMPTGDDSRPISSDLVEVFHIEK